jgi:hypothetical protein
VSMLQKDFAEETTVREEDDQVADDVTLTVPDATLWTAAHIARRRKASVRYAQMLIEAAIRRALIRVNASTGSDAIVIAPDDLMAY